MYAEKEQWLTLLLGGLILIIGFNIGLAIRDTKGIQSIQETETVYKQLPVIPFTNEQL